MVGTPNADEIVLEDRRKHLHQLHAPYHLHLIYAAGAGGPGARSRPDRHGHVPPLWTGSCQPGSTLKLSGSRCRVIRIARPTLRNSCKLIFSESAFQQLVLSLTQRIYWIIPSVLCLL